ncbi:ABC transporter permease [Salinactinospora qingdaonensis]|uniref:ABC transporter permease n=1 Tax=Salinactinospora qingdaonensis TaxID=702744 RepID=A0ABP7FK46_9ACTN
MNTTTNAVRAGAWRGWVEFRQSLTNAQDLLGYFLMPAVFLVISFSVGGETIPGTQIPAGALIMAGAVGFLVFIAGGMTVAQILAMEREDGTLLRSKAVPQGMLGYFVGKTCYMLLMTTLGVAIIVVPPVLLIDGFAVQGVAGWFHLVWVCLLGLFATVPIGAAIGSLISNPRMIGLVMLPFMALAMASGIFFPITAMPGWVQTLVQVFPVYWLGLGARSALLPAEAAQVELAGSWQHLEIAGVLGLWGVVGFLVAPVLLRRMARRESGSRVAQARTRAMNRPY